jgi:hypothetical protein
VREQKHLLALLRLLGEKLHLRARPERAVHIEREFIGKVSRIKSDDDPIGVFQRKKL